MAYHGGMEVRTYPNWMRPGVGLTPRREGQRPLLPQHARHCPVLEAGSALGWLVFPALEPTESYLIEFLGEGRYQFSYFLSPGDGTWEPCFAIAIGLPVGGVGMITEDVTFMVRDPPISKEDAKRLARAFFVPEDLGTPPGAVTLRGATKFRTPSGWDTVYTPVFNNIERPLPSMLIVRVETDWYAHDTEFRYVLQPGEGISGTHHLPIGQVVFVSREEMTLGTCSDDELEEIRRSKEVFFREKAARRVRTPYGLQYSPHYLQQSRAQKD
jgi:hypothetical protein